MHRAVVLVIALLAIGVLPGQAQDRFSPFNVHVGGGIGVPLDPTARFAGISGTFQFGAGPNINKHSSIVGEFMWHGLPPNRNALRPLINPLATSEDSFKTSNNLYALTANYMFHMEGQRYGFYLIGGGGWYFRHLALKQFTVQPGTICEPAWDWWGYTCESGFVSTTNTLATRGVSSGGVNAGGGITINMGGEPRTQFYIEARYHYSPQGGRVSTHIVPVTLGLRW